MGWLWTVALQTYPMAYPVITFWYPLVASIMAIEMRNTKEDQLWMTYWMLYALVSTVELIVAPAIPWIPFYSAIKLVVAAWLVLPQFRGAIVLYKELVHPYFSAATKVTFTNGEHKWSTHISADANESAAIYIKKHGANAFEALMESATRSIKVDEAEKVEKVEEVRKLF